MMEFFLTSSILIAGIFGIRFLFGSHMRQRMKYALWLLVLVKLLMPFLCFHTPYSTMQLAQHIHTRLKAEGQMPASSALAPVSKTNQAKEPARKASIRTKGHAAAAADRTLNAAYLIWIAGICITGGSILASNIRFYRRLKSCRKEIFAECCPITVYESKAANGPCLYGVVHPAVYLPAGLASTDVCMEHIITHEYVHFRHKDHLWALLRCICVSIYWFHPFVWAAASASIKDGELACDEAVVLYLGESRRQAYGNTLIQMASYTYGNQPLLSCASHAKGKKSEMKRRIQMIVKKPKTAAVTIVILILAVFLLTGAAFSNTDTKKAPGDAQAGQLNQTQITEHTDHAKPIQESSKQDAASKTAADDSSDFDDSNDSNHAMDAWTIHIGGTGGSFLEVTGCQEEKGAYVLCGSSYAKPIVLTEQEKKRLDNGVPAAIAYDGMEGQWTLQKAAHTDTENEYLLTTDQTYGMILVEQKEDGQSSWILSDPLSGMPWYPLLNSDARITVAPDTPVEANNYYSYYDYFQNYFKIKMPDAAENGGQERNWTMQQYYEYLMHIEAMAKDGQWAGGMLAKVQILESDEDGHMYLIDQYLP